ncbi:unnamed protein product [Anisakis simplex]|uniref:Uncharacterized protein n=1 Tax=Anisakis simplex TaxID=6269 RepID=A0A3P6Q200_ANISI|nr:unnamed protein product [Anisakis simplex]
MSSDSNCMPNNATVTQDITQKGLLSGNMSLVVPQSSKVPSSGRTKAGRLKVALQPGRGIMDWVKLTSGRNIASKQMQFVDEVELSKHNTVDNCWIVLENKVYDVTEYLTFHPGGVNELMRAAGCDGTILFNKYHAWINHETMLKACFVGYFKGNIDKLPTPKDEWVPDCFSRILGTTDGKIVLNCDEWMKLKKENVCVDVCGNALRVLIKPLGCTPPISLAWNGIPKLLMCDTFIVSVESGVIEIKFDHSREMSIFSSLDLVTIKKRPGLLFRVCTISQIRKITHNTNLYELDLPLSTYLSLPVGHHVYLRIDKKVVAFTRPYTPILVDANRRKISFLIKLYEDGKFTYALRRLQIGDQLEISDPVGDIDFLSACSTELCCICAGTGITPMIRLLNARKNDSNRHVFISSLLRLKWLALGCNDKDRLEQEFYKYCGLEPARDHVSLFHYEEEDHDVNILMLSKFIEKQKSLILKECREDGASVEHRYRVLVCGPPEFMATVESYNEQIDLYCAVVCCGEGKQKRDLKGATALKNIEDGVPFTHKVLRSLCVYG